MSQQRPAPAEAPTRGPWLLAAAGVVVFHLAWQFQGDEARHWLPGLGLGITLIAWLGWRIVPLLAVDLLLARWLAFPHVGVPLILADSLIHLSLIVASWWLYHHIALGSRWLDDPRSATIFLILVPGTMAALTAMIQALYWAPDQLGILAAQLWLSRMVGILVVTPFLIVTCTPLLLRHGLVDIEMPPALFGERESSSRLGDRIELAGLTFASCVLAVLLVWTHVRSNDARWMLWGACLILIVWTCVRQGLFGGCFAAGLTSSVVLIAVHVFEIAPESRLALQSGIQGNLLAFCSSALLLGTSATWIRANETRYRHVVSRIPFVVYSARLPHGIPTYAPPESGKPRPDSKPDVRVGPSISKLANVLLVSPACKDVFGTDAESLIGPFERWLDRIVAEDHELIIAALTQICLQRQPVTCEYRLRAVGDKAEAPAGPARLAFAPAYRWVRDTMTPHYSEEGLVNGWEGLIEDITDQRRMSHDLRRMTNMLQVLITNMPTGVYFVQAPLGFPLLVNARARQLLGQREDLSAGLATLSKVFRLHRPDGTDYPGEELPVYKALHQGVTCRANDIVVHRADGRKIPLITWAAPIELSNTGSPDAAVWVLEDWTAMQQAEVALRESELRLRAIIEAMGEGVVVQDDTGTVIDCNAAACGILSAPRNQVIGRSALVPESKCVKEDGAPFARADQPYVRALRDHQPARGVILGIRRDANDEVRWLLVNAMPLPVGVAVGLNPQKARVVTTFADITEQVKTQDTLRLTKDRYQNLVETLPFMLVQRDASFKITYLNPAASALTGHSIEELMQPGFCESIIHPDDEPQYQRAMQTVAEGRSTRVEGRFQAKDGSFKSVLAFLHPNLQHGEVIGSTSLVVDITMQRRLEEELRHSQHLELIGRLASGIVHDFNHWLTVMVGFAGCAKAELTSAHAAWPYLSRIEDSGAQAAHLAGQLLTFSKQRPRQVQPVDLNAVVVQTLKLAKSVMPARIDVETALAPELPMACGDENQFKQIVMNLCLNARDAMPDGGALTIRTCVDAPPAHPAADARNAWVHLSIQDSGVGMPEDVRSRVFEPFFSTKENGTGLGLSVVQQIVKESGGIIEVWSKPDEGTRFDIWLAQAISS